MWSKLSIGRSEPPPSSSSTSKAARRKSNGSSTSRKRAESDIGRSSSKYGQVDSGSEDLSRSSRRSKPASSHDVDRTQMTRGASALKSAQVASRSSRDSSDGKECSRGPTSEQSDGQSQCPVDAPLSSNVPNQFPDQAPQYWSLPYRPPGGQNGLVGEAADYYGDQGQSVHAQPGVRPGTPILMNTEPHLMAALPTPNPPQETGNGAAAEFYASSSIVDNTQTSIADNTQTSIANDYSQNAPSRPPAKPGNESSHHSSAQLPLAAAGVAGMTAATLAYNHHQTHHSSQIASSTGAGRPSTEPFGPTEDGYDSAGSSLQNSQHEHRGTVSRFVDWWNDYEDVRKMEEYTEYIGVCRYCFDPHTSIRDAPRKHRPRRRPSSEFESKNRVDKDKRYSRGSSLSSSDSDGAGTGIFAAGLAGLGLASSKSRRIRKSVTDDSLGTDRRERYSSLQADRKRTSQHDVTKLSRESDKLVGRQGSSGDGSLTSRVFRNQTASRPVSSALLVGASAGAASFTIAEAARRASKSPSRAPRRKLVNDSKTGTRRRQNSTSSSETSVGFFSKLFSSRLKRPENRPKKISGTRGTKQSKMLRPDLQEPEAILSLAASKTKSKRTSSPKTAAEAVAGLGAAAALLTAVESGRDRSSRRQSELFAVREQRSSSGKSRRDDAYQSSSHHFDGSSEEVWEDASDSEALSSAESEVAFGHDLHAGGSSSALESAFFANEHRHGRRKIGDNPNRPDSRRPAANPHVEVPPPIAVSFADASQGRRRLSASRSEDKSYREALRNAHLRDVEPIPLDNPPFEPWSKTHILPTENHAQAVPLHQPRPIIPVKLPSFDAQPQGLPSKSDRRTSYPRSAQSYPDPSELHHSRRRTFQEIDPVRPSADEMSSDLARHRDDQVPRHKSSRVSAYQEGMGPSIGQNLRDDAVLGAAGIVAGAAASAYESGKRTDATPSREAPPHSAEEERSERENSSYSRAERDEPVLVQTALPNTANMPSAPRHQPRDDLKDLSRGQSSSSFAEAFEPNVAAYKAGAENIAPHKSEIVASAESNVYHQTREVKRAEAESTYDDDVFDPDFFNRPSSDSVLRKHSEPMMDIVSGNDKRAENEVPEDFDTASDNGTEFQPAGVYFPGSVRKWVPAVAGSPPIINLIQPTPPGSYAGSFRDPNSRAPSPLHEKVMSDSATSGPHQKPKNRVSWGEPETLVYEAETPESFRREYFAQGVDLTKAAGFEDNTKEVTDQRDIEYQKPAIRAGVGSGSELAKDRAGTAMYTSQDSTLSEIQDDSQSPGQTWASSKGNDVGAMADVIFGSKAIQSATKPRKIHGVDPGIDVEAGSPERPAMPGAFFDEQTSNEEQEPQSKQDQNKDAFYRVEPHSLPFIPEPQLPSPQLAGKEEVPESKRSKRSKKDNSRSRVDTNSDLDEAVPLNATTPSQPSDRNDGDQTAARSPNGADAFDNGTTQQSYARETSIVSSSKEAKRKSKNSTGLANFQKTNDQCESDEDNRVSISSKSTRSISSGGSATRPKEKGKGFFGLFKRSMSEDLAKTKHLERDHPKDGEESSLKGKKKKKKTKRRSTPDETSDPESAALSIAGGIPRAGDGVRWDDESVDLQKARRSSTSDAMHGRGEEEEKEGEREEEEEEGEGREEEDSGRRSQILEKETPSWKDAVVPGEMLATSTEGESSPQDQRSKASSPASDIDTPSMSLDSLMVLQRETPRDDLSSTNRNEEKEAYSYPVSYDAIPEMVRLPVSRPGSPYDAQLGPALTATETSGQFGKSLSPIDQASRTAIPLRFRAPPMSPTLTRETSPLIAQAHSSPGAPIQTPLPRSRTSRPSSLEFKNSSEFRPLYLLEANLKSSHPDLEETLPSLPLSRSSSVHGSDENFESTSSSVQGSPQSTHDDDRSWQTNRRPSEEPEFLDSQQATPRASAASAGLPNVPPLDIGVKSGVSQDNAGEEILQELGAPFAMSTRHGNLSPLDTGSDSVKDVSRTSDVQRSDREQNSGGTVSDSPTGISRGLSRHVEDEYMQGASTEGMESVSNTTLNKADDVLQPSDSAEVSRLINRLADYGASASENGKLVDTSPSLLDGDDAELESQQPVSVLTAEDTIESAAVYSQSQSQIVPPRVTETSESSSQQGQPENQSFSWLFKGKKKGKKSKKTQQDTTKVEAEGLNPEELNDVPDGTNSTTRDQIFALRADDESTTPLKTNKLKKRQRGKRLVNDDRKSASNSEAEYATTAGELAFEDAEGTLPPEDARAYSDDILMPQPFNPPASPGTPVKREKDEGACKISKAEEDIDTESTLQRDMSQMASARHIQDRSTEQNPDFAQENENVDERHVPSRSSEANSGDSPSTAVENQLESETAVAHDAIVNKNGSILSHDLDKYGDSDVSASYSMLDPSAVQVATDHPQDCLAEEDAEPTGREDTKTEAIPDDDFAWSNTSKKKKKVKNGRTQPPSDNHISAYGEPLEALTGMQAVLEKGNELNADTNKADCPSAEKDDATAPAVGAESFVVAPLTVMTDVAAAADGLDLFSRKSSKPRRKEKKNKKTKTGGTFDEPEKAEGRRNSDASASDVVDLVEPRHGVAQLQSEDNGDKGPDWEGNTSEREATDADRPRSTSHDEVATDLGSPQRRSIIAETINAVPTKSDVLEGEEGMSRRLDRSVGKGLPDSDVKEELLEPKEDERMQEMLELPADSTPSGGDEERTMQYRSSPANDDTPIRQADALSSESSNPTMVGKTGSLEEMDRGSLITDISPMQENPRPDNVDVTPDESKAQDEFLEEDDALVQNRAVGQDEIEDTEMAGAEYAWSVSNMEPSGKKNKKGKKKKGGSALDFQPAEPESQVQYPIEGVEYKNEPDVEPQWEVWNTTLSGKKGKKGKKKLSAPASDEVSEEAKPQTEFDGSSGALPTQGLTRDFDAASNDLQLEQAEYSTLELGGKVKSEKEKTGKKGEKGNKGGKGKKGEKRKKGRQSTSDTDQQNPAVELQHSPISSTGYRSSQAWTRDGDEAKDESDVFASAPLIQKLDNASLDPPLAELVDDQQMQGPATFQSSESHQAYGTSMQLDECATADWDEAELAEAGLLQSKKRMATTESSPTRDAHETRIHQPQDNNPTELSRDSALEGHQTFREQDAEPYDETRKDSGPREDAQITALGTRTRMDDSMNTQRGSPPQSRSLSPSQQWASSSLQHTTGSYEDAKPSDTKRTDDVDFTATLAAGLQDTGFDPDLVLNDAPYHVRSKSQSPHGQASSDRATIERSESLSRRRSPKANNAWAFSTLDDMENGASVEFASRKVTAASRSNQEISDDIVALGLDDAEFDPETAVETSPSRNGPVTPERQMRARSTSPDRHSPRWRRSNSKRDVSKSAESLDSVPNRNYTSLGHTSEAEYHALNRDSGYQGSIPATPGSRISGFETETSRNTRDAPEALEPPSRPRSMPESLSPTDAPLLELTSKDRTSSLFRSPPSPKRSGSSEDHSSQSLHHLTTSFSKEEEPDFRSPTETSTLRRPSSQVRDLSTIQEHGGSEGMESENGRSHEKSPTDVETKRSPMSRKGSSERGMPTNRDMEGATTPGGFSAAASAAASAVSQRSGTPTLHRSNPSSDLGVEFKRGLAHSSLSDNNTFDPQSASRRLQNYDPLRGSGKDRRQDMSDQGVYEGWGDVQDSPRSPSRPQSVRRRQSTQLLDLESRLDQLTAENRSLRQGRGLGEDNSGSGQDLARTLRTRDEQLHEKDVEINSIRTSLTMLQSEVSRLTEHNGQLQSISQEFGTVDGKEKAELQAERDHVHEQWQASSRELGELREKHGALTTGMQDAISTEVAAALANKNAEIRSLRVELDHAAQKIKSLQQQILASTQDSDFLNTRDKDFFESACQQLCQHVQQWVLRFSKFSDMRVCRSVLEIQDESIETRLDNAILDGTDVDVYLADRVRRRDVFMSVVMTLIWEFIFTRYLFGMDRDQRQKLKNLEKLLIEVGPQRAVAQWRATTLTLLSRRPAFEGQREQDTEAVVLEVYRTLSAILPPPHNLIGQIKDSLRNLMRLAVDLSIDMRTQRAEYMMLPPLRPEYDTNGDLVRKVFFNASLMNERSGEFESNEQLERDEATIRLVLFPLVVKKGDGDGDEAEEIVIAPAQVHVSRDFERRDRSRARVMSGTFNRSTASIFPPSTATIGSGGAQEDAGNYV